jgi:hypothetical protein
MSGRQRVEERASRLRKLRQVVLELVDRMLGEGDGDEAR